MLNAIAFAIAPQMLGKSLGALPIARHPDAAACATNDDYATTARRYNDGAFTLGRITARQSVVRTPAPDAFELFTMLARAAADASPVRLDYTASKYSAGYALAYMGVTHETTAPGRLIGFYETTRAFEEGRFTEITPARFAKRLLCGCGDLPGMTREGMKTKPAASWIDDIAARFSQLFAAAYDPAIADKFTFQRGTSREEFARVYSTRNLAKSVSTLSRRGDAACCLRGSCMQHEPDYFNATHHPCEAYASGDFEIWSAWTSDGELGARVILQVSDRTISTPVYAATPAAAKALCDAVEAETGARPDDSGHDLEGRLLAIEDRRGILAPYLDSRQCLDYSGRYLEFGGYIETDQYGWLEAQDMTNCECCGDRVHDEDVIYIDSEEVYYCSDCARRHTFRSDYSGEYFMDSENTSVSVQRRPGVYAVEHWARDEAEDHACVCEYDGEFWEHDSTVICESDGYYYGMLAIEDGAIVDVDGDYYLADDDDVAFTPDGRAFLWDDDESGRGEVIAAGIAAMLAAAAAIRVHRDAALIAAADAGEPGAWRACLRAGLLPWGAPVPRIARAMVRRFA